MLACLLTKAQYYLLMEIISLDNEHIFGDNKTTGIYIFEFLPFTIPYLRDSDCGSFPALLCSLESRNLTSEFDSDDCAVDFWQPSVPRNNLSKTNSLPTSTSYYSQLSSFSFSVTSRHDQIIGTRYLTASVLRWYLV